MKTILSYQHQQNTIRALTDYLRFFAHDHLIYNNSVLEVWHFNEEKNPTT